MVVDLREQVVEQPADPFDALVGQQLDPLEQVLDELTELRAAIGRKPSMSAITRMGMCCAYSCAASTTSRPSNPSSSDWQNALITGSCLPTAVFVNAGSSSLRASWWNGGSEEMGGDSPANGASSRGGRKLLRMIDREEKRSVS